MLTIVQGDLGKRGPNTIPCRCAYGDVWEIHCNYLVVGTRRPKMLTGCQYDITFVGPNTETVDALMEHLETMGAVLVEDHCPGKGARLFACLLTGVKWHGYTEREHLADYLLYQAEVRLNMKAQKVN